MRGRAAGLRGLSPPSATGRGPRSLTVSSDSSHLTGVSPLAWWDSGSGPTLPLRTAALALTMVLNFVVVRLMLGRLGASVPLAHP